MEAELAEKRALVQECDAKLLELESLLDDKIAAHAAKLDTI